MEGYSSDSSASAIKFLQAKHAGAAMLTGQSIPTG